MSESEWKTKKKNKEYTKSENTTNALFYTPPTEILYNVPPLSLRSDSN